MRSTQRPDRNRVSISFKRDDFVTILWALESVLEDAKYHGGLETVEDEMRLAERIRQRLSSHDTTPYRRVSRV